MKYASADIPACPGTFKSLNEDFRVFEVPLYEFSGEGDHTLVHIEKTGISTFEATRRICNELKFREKDVGYAGLKDAKGVTRQWLSFEHTNPESFLALDLPKLKILEVSKHGNKLKRGHLLANRFEVGLRDVAEENVTHAIATMKVLEQRGVPNWYDTQRFGRRGDNATVGMYILRDDIETYFDALLGDAESENDPATKEARAAYESEGAEKALELWPRRDNQSRKALQAVAKLGKTWQAMKKLPQKLKLLQVSAVQSLLFKSVLDARFEDFDKVWTGDICRKDNGADFLVEDAEPEQPRAASFEISPTGPIFGHKMRSPEGRMAELEHEVLTAAELEPAMFDIGRGLSQKGDRRPLRFQLSELATEYADGALTLKFTLPKGCYATVVLKEITKSSDELAI